MFLQKSILFQELSKNTTKSIVFFSVFCAKPRYMLYTGHSVRCKHLSWSEHSENGEFKTRVTMISPHLPFTTTVVDGSSFVFAIKTIIILHNSRMLIIYFEET